MSFLLQVLDCDYVRFNGKPLIRIFGKDERGKTYCVFYEGFYPYFYILPKSKKKVIDFLKKKFENEIVKIEEVEKYLPLGFKKNPTKLLKITLKDPSKTPSIREELRRLDEVKEIYEADILFKYRFFSDFGINGMGWIKVDGTPERTTTVKTKVCIRANKITPIEKFENVKFKYLAFDIEISTPTGVPDPAKDPISIISLSFYPSYRNLNTLVLVAKPVKKFNKDVISFSTEKEMLTEFLKIIDEFDPDIITGYNLTNFDIPYLNERLKHLKLPRTLGRSIDKFISSRKISENRYRNSILGRIIADPYLIIREMVKRGFFLGLKRYGLGDVSKYLLGEDKVDVSHSEIHKLWKGNEKEIEKLIRYARKDAELALKLLLENKFLEKYIAISRVSGLLLQDALDSGEAGKVECLLLKEFNRRNFVIPCKPTGEEVKKREEEREKKGLKGAFVLDPKIGLHNQCVVYLDFTSMYPSIYIAYNICPTTLLFKKEEGIETIETPYGVKFVSTKIRKGIIPQIVKVLIEKRKKVKKMMKKEKNEDIRRMLDAKQEALKRMANAFYGYTGYLRARLYILDVANAITSCGRNLIHLSKRIVEKETKYEVIYGDTDSIMVKTNTGNLEEAFKIGEKISNLINKKLPESLNLKIESIFKTLLILSKKRYVGWSFEKIGEEWREKMVMKGIETVRRDWCELVGEVLQNVLNTILKEQNPRKALGYLRGIIKKLHSNEIEIEKLIITKGISKPLHEYKGVQPHIELVKRLRKRNKGSAPGVGDRIGFVIVKGVELISQRAEDPTYVKEHGLEIDSRYYIENQLLPPLERVFEAIGISKSELVGVGKQLLLFEAIKNNNKKEKEEDVLTSIEAFICDKCNKIYRRIPLLGRCECGGEIVFYYGGKKSKYVAPQVGRVNTSIN